MKVLTLALTIVLSTVGAGQKAERFAKLSLPRVVLRLPGGMPSEHVQVSYFLTGSFGGYGGFVPSARDQKKYVIPEFVKDQPAKEIKIVVYMPGCEFVTLDLVPLGKSEQQLVCEPLGSVPLHGKIVPVSITGSKPSEIEVIYLADWQMAFEGIYDGMVPTYNVAIVLPDENGDFDLRLPDFGKDPRSREGSFQFRLREQTTWNIVAFLNSTNAGTSLQALEVLSAYPATVEFKARKP